jgi:hypothetical protein
MKKSPSGGCQLGNRGSDSEAWADCAGAHGQEPIKSFKPRSMMQEHLRCHGASSAGIKSYSWTTPAHAFLNYFEKIVAPSFE